MPFNASSDGSVEETEDSEENESDDEYSSYPPPGRYLNQHLEKLQDKYV